MGQRDVQRDRTRSAIAAEAARQFDERGYPGATMRSIADALGLTVGALFFHFPSKESLAAHVVDAAAERERTALTEVAAAGSPLELLVRESIRLVELYRDDVGVAAALRLARDLPASLDVGSRPSDRWRERAAAALRQAQAQEELRAGLDLDAVAYQSVAVVLGVLQMADERASRAELPSRLRGVWQVLVPALARPGADLGWLARV